jgi:arabinan endo-1,5-alpha-L-arabinosidase
VQVTADVTDARLGDPYATVSTVSPGHGRQAGVVGTGDVDNVAANAEYTAHTSVAPPPKIGKLDKADSDDFTGGLGSGWTWKNEDPAAVVKDGQLNWPTEDTDLSDPNSADQAGVLLRNEPSGNYTVETKLTINTGVDTVRNFQQAGLVIYVNNDQFLRYDHVAAGTTRFLEFGKVTVQNGVRSWGAAIIGPPATTTWLRITHTTNSAGEGLYRAGSSRDGRHWIWGAVWTLPAGSHPQIGLISQGSNAATDAQYGKANAQFDYFHIYK